MLDGQELARVGVVLYIAVGLDQEFVAGHKAATPAGHVKGLAGGVEFDADLLGAGSGQEAERFALENQRGVCGVMNDYELVALGEGNGFGKKLGRRARAGGVVRIIQHQHLRPLQDFAGDTVQVGEKPVWFGQGQVVDQAAIVFGMRAEHRVARRGHQDIIAGIDQRGRQDGESGFAADRVDHLGFRVDPGHAADPLQVTCRGLLETGVPIVRIPAVFRFPSLLAQRVHYFRERHFIRFANAHVNDFGSGMGRHGGALGALDFFEFVNRVGLAVLTAPDALRKQVLYE